LVLLRVQSRLKRSAFTEMQKLAQGKAKIRQVSKKRGRIIGWNSSTHICIVSRYK
jgi:hypothetical protein